MPSLLDLSEFLEVCDSSIIVPVWAKVCVRKPIAE